MMHNDRSFFIRLAGLISANFYFNILLISLQHYSNRGVEIKEHINHNQNHNHTKNKY